MRSRSFCAASSSTWRAPSSVVVVASFRRQRSRPARSRTSGAGPPRPEAPSRRAPSFPRFARRAAGRRARPCARCGWRIVVSGGSTKRASTRSSNPVTDNLLRNAEPALPEDLHGAERHAVVCRDERVEGHAARERVPHRLDAGSHREVAGHDELGIVRHAVALERLAVHLETAPRVGVVFGPAEKEEAVPPVIDDEVIDGLREARAVVNDDARNSRRGAHPGCKAGVRSPSPCVSTAPRPSRSPRPEAMITRPSAHCFRTNS